MTREREEEEFKVSKNNRRTQQEKEGAGQIYHPPLLYRERSLSRQEKDKKINLIVRKARKRH